MASIKENLAKLRAFLLKKSLYYDAYAVGKIALASDAHQDGEVEPIDPDETVAMRPRPWKSMSEPYLLRAGLKPIRFIAGTEARRRKEGKESKEGNIYEVLTTDGELAVAKVLIGYSSLEPENWKRIIDAKKSLPEDQAKHLPEIYDIIEGIDKHVTIILMERLEPPSSHMKRVLRTKELRDEDRILKNEEFLSEALRHAFSLIDDYKSSGDERVHSEAFALLDADRLKIRHDVEGEMIKKTIGPSDIAERIIDISSGYISMFRKQDMDIEEDQGLVEEIANKIQEKFNKYVETSPRPVAKYYSSRDIDNTIEVLESGSSPDRPPDKAKSERLNALNEERSKYVYTESPEGFLYSEKYMPETKGLFSLLNSLKELGIEWSDVHANNIMERPGTRDLVLIDVGFFS